MDADHTDPSSDPDLSSDPDPSSGPDSSSDPDSRFDTIEYRTDGRVAIVSLDRPQYRNAQSRHLLDEFDLALDRAVADDEVRVIVVRGNGPHFSSGHDLGTPEELADRKDRPWPDGWLGDQRRSWELNVTNTLRWRDLPKPTIASVQGMCIYGGWMVASAMDLIVAADDAQFLPAHFQYFSVPWDLGPRQTKELLWLAEFIGADQAKELGFVNHVVARDELDDATLALANRIARFDKFAASMVKRSVNEMQDQQGFRTSITAAHSTYMQLQAAGLVVPDGQDGKIRRLPSVEASLGEQGAATEPNEPPGPEASPEDPVEAFLGARSRLAMLTTLRRDGTPTTVPVWFEWASGELSIFCEAASSKLDRIRRDPRISVTVANDLDEPEFWVAFDGVAAIEPDGGLAVAERLAPAYWDLSDPGRVATLAAWREAGDGAMARIVLRPERVRRS